MIQEDKSRIPGTILAGFVVVLLLLGGLLLLTRSTKIAGPAAELQLPFTATEQAYAAQIHFSAFKMTRAANFLNQEVTFLFGTVSNDGPRKIREMEVTLEFRDMFNQVVLRDARRILGSRSAPLAGGQHREFQVGFEHIPADWNRQLPSIRVTALLLE